MQQVTTTTSGQPVIIIGIKTRTATARVQWANGQKGFLPLSQLNLPTPI